MRQCQLWLGPGWRGLAQVAPLDLAAAPYGLVAGTWRDAQQELVETDIVLRAGTMTELSRHAANVRRYLTIAEAYAQAMNGKPVYVYSKTSDSLPMTAELGATWRRRRVHGGELVISPDGTIRSQKSHTVTGKLKLWTSGPWERAGVSSALYSANTVASQLYPGGLTVHGEVAARRRLFDGLSGLTARYQYLHNGSAITFINPDAVEWYAAFVSSPSPYFAISDSNGYVVASDPVSLTGLVDVVFVWQLSPSETGTMAIYVNGKPSKSEVVIGMALTGALDEYVLLAPNATLELAQAQVWPAALSAAQVEALYLAGMPEAELCLVRRPADRKNTNAAYTIYTTPGDGPAQVRLLLGTEEGTQDYEKALVGLRALRTPATTRWECEAGTLGANTATNSNAAASGGSQARFTPANTAEATRVTVTLAADASDVDALIGEHRLLLAGYDSAASVQLNLLSWRVVTAGVAGDWSDDLAFAAVGKRGLLELGTLSIPAGAWPEEALTANSDVYADAYLALEIRVRNTAASGTLDMDAVYLFPAEQGGAALGALDVSHVLMALDFASDPPATTLAADEQQLEFAGWVEWGADQLRLLPEITSNGAGLLQVYAYRDAVEEAMPNDLIDVYLFVRPTWASA